MSGNERDAPPADKACSKACLPAKVLRNCKLKPVRPPCCLSDHVTLCARIWSWYA